MTPSSETVQYDSGKLAGLRGGASRRRTLNAAGMPLAAYGARRTPAPVRLGRQARLAQAFAKFRPARRSMSTRMGELRHAGAFGA